MAECGWFTRSLGQKAPYDLNYSVAISPDQLKEAFSQTIEHFQRGKDLETVHVDLFQGLILQRNRQKIDLTKPADLPIAEISSILGMQFEAKYAAVGASLLPVISIHALYECWLQETKRVESKKLPALESHTYTDTRSERIGDIEEEKRKLFESAEIKHSVPITSQMVKDELEKF